MPEPMPTDELSARLAEDEARLAADEARLERDEQRLLPDEARLETDQLEVRESRTVAWFGVGLAVALTLAVAALGVSLVALQGDVGSLSRSAPTGSVGTDALRDASVTSDKLASGAVGSDAIAGGSVGRGQLAPDAVAAAQVARNSLTGGDIAEGTLATVPAARRAQLAEDADRLGGLRSRAYLSRLVDVSATSLADARKIKGPVTAQCPSGTRILSGGAVIRGAARGAAIVSSAPAGGTAWTATARVSRTPPPAWRLVVSAVCASGGEYARADAIPRRGVACGHERRTARPERSRRPAWRAAGARVHGRGPARALGRDRLR